jgi:hypothetical protein
MTQNNLALVLVEQAKRTPQTHAATHLAPRRVAKPCSGTVASWQYRRHAAHGPLAASRCLAAACVCVGRLWTVCGLRFWSIVSALRRILQPERNRRMDQQISQRVTLCCSASQRRRSRQVRAFSPLLWQISIWTESSTLAVVADPVGSDAVNVLLGDGAGRFGGPSNFAVGATPSLCGGR